MDRKQEYTLYFGALRNKVTLKKLHLPTPLYGLRNIIFALGTYIFGLTLIGIAPVGVVIIWFSVTLVELAYISHDLLHQQYFRSLRLNNFFSYISANICIGLSRSWWIKKHNNEHHNYTNSDIHDSDIRDYDEIFTRNPGKFPFFHKHKRILFWLSTTLLFFNLIYLSYKHIIVNKKYLEGVLNLISLGLLPAFLIFQYGFFEGIGALVCIYVLVGIHLAFAFMVNHIGMPVLDGNTIQEYSWLELQIKTSRNISGGKVLHHIFGGLNKQVEHHLFPRVSRKNITAVADEVRAFCNEKNISYHETTFSESLSEIRRTLDVSKKEDPSYK